MNALQEEHTKDHNEWVRLLVEGELQGERKQAVERRLLSCLGCLEEYNAYRRFWKTVTSHEYRRAQEEHLKQTNVDLYRKYAELMEQLANARSESATTVANSKRILNLSLFNQSAFSVSLIILLVLVLPYFAYKSIRLGQEKASLLESNRHYQRLIEKQLPPEKIREEVRTQYERQIVTLTEKLAELSKPEMATSYSIVPRGHHRGRDEEYAPIKFSKEAKFLILTVGVKSGYATYAIELSDATRESLWQKGGGEAGSRKYLFGDPERFL